MAAAAAAAASLKGSCPSEEIRGATHTHAAVSVTRATGGRPRRPGRVTCEYLGNGHRGGECPAVAFGLSTTGGAVRVLSFLFRSFLFARDLRCWGL